MQSIPTIETVLRPILVILAGFSGLLGTCIWLLGAMRGDKNQRTNALIGLAISAGSLWILILILWIIGQP